MRRAACIFCLLVLASGAFAQNRILWPPLIGAPSWVVPGASVDLKFSAGTYYASGKVNSFGNLVTFTRASIGWAKNSSDVWTKFISGAPRITDLGFLNEGARTNVVLRNRDFTNASWVKSNMTAAKDQTGIDNVTSAASSLTATSGNATALQTVTDTSKARWVSVFIKRITGSGVVNVTMDNGATWTAVTPCSAGTFIGNLSCRVSIPTQTLANPVVGVRIVTSGDAVAVDMFQSENSGLFGSSPIDTLGASVARLADVSALTDPTLVSITQGTMFGAYNNVMASATTAEVFMYRVDANNKIGIELNTSNLIQFYSFVSSAFTAQLTVANTISATGSYRTAAAYAANNFTAAFSASLQSGVLTDSSGAVPAGTIAVGIGNNNAGQQLYGYVDEVAFAPTVQSSAQILAWAQP